MKREEEMREEEKGEEMKRDRDERRERDERRDDSVEQCLKTKNPPDELPHNDSEKSPSIELFVRKFRTLPVF